jgi:hypothetical protein
MFIDPDDAILCIFVFGSCGLTGPALLHISCSIFSMDMDSFMHNSSFQSRAKRPLPARALRFQNLDVLIRPKSVRCHIRLSIHFLNK